MKQSYKKIQQEKRKKKSIAFNRKQMIYKRAFIKAIEDMKSQHHLFEDNQCRAIIS